MVEIVVSKSRELRSCTYSIYDFEPLSLFNDSLVDRTQEYTYLRVKLTPSGHFTPAQEQLHEKAIRAFFYQHN